MNKTEQVHQPEKSQKLNRIHPTVTKGYAKVPVVMQMEMLECGAACLTMILAYYGKWLPLEQVRSDCGVSRDGSNAKNVLKAARSYGLEAKGYRYEPEQLQREGRFPCIIHWNFCHFVVLCGFKGNKVILNDPARGTVQISMQEFDEGFTGICLMFEPTDAFVPDGRPKSIRNFVGSKLKGTAPAFVFVILTALVTSLIGVINPAFSRILIDRLLTGKNPDWLYPFVLIMLAFAFAEILIAAVRTIYMLKIQGKLAIVANTGFMWHVLRMPMEFFTQRMAGDIAARQASNEGIAAALIDEFAPLMINFVMLLFYLVIMFRYSPLLTLVGLLSVIINLLVAREISKQRMNITRVQMCDNGKLAAATVNGIEMIETIKASGAENGYFQKWSGYQASVNSQTVRFMKLNQYLGSVPELVSSVTNIAILVLGVYLTMEGQFTVGMILAFQGFMTSFIAPANALISAGQNYQEMRTNMERIEDIMEYPVDVEDQYRTSADISTVQNGRKTEVIETGNTPEPENEPQSYRKLSGNLVMKHVTFGYSKLEPPFIEDFNLELKSGSRVAFVGASGSGKSTLSKLISGLYQPWSGEILFDGKPAAEIDHAVFTGSLAVVDQDIILFEDTIANNIKMWDSSIEDFEMILAARDANIHEDIMQRDGGYQHKLLEGGQDFSGGQRQRLEIARVLAQDPTIIIMDEATGALDAKTEYDVVNAIEARGITCIVVAHRLSTIRDCDEIIVMERGRVVERGTHDELMAMNGKYRELITSE